MIIDGGGSFNLFENLNLKIEEHSNSYQIGRVNNMSILVRFCCLVTFNFSNTLKLLV